MCDAIKGQTAYPLLTAESPAVIAHLNMLQGIITRLAGNSAQCKTWCITLVTALIAFAGATHTTGPIVFAIVPVGMLLILDVTYLAQERAYRDLFNDMVVRVRARSYDENALFAAGAAFTWHNWFGALQSWSVTPFYASLVVGYVVVMLSGPLAASLVSVK
jgi:hypothetical protein